MARFRAPSSDSEDEPMPSPEKQQPTKGKTVSRYQPESEESDEGSDIYSEVEHASEDEEDDEDEDEDDEDSEPEIGQRRADPSILPWAREIGVAPQRMHVMQSTLFRQPEEAAALRDVAQGPSHRRIPQLGRKHSRDSEGEGLRAESRPRTSFADDLELQAFRPTRKFARVDNSASAVKGTENTLVDAGLAVGRSFRVGWGPGGRVVHVGSLCSPSGSSTRTSNSSVVHITTLPVFPTSDKEAESQASILLKHHLSNSPIEFDEDGVPCANPSTDLTFSSFVSLFPSNDRSFETSLFRLGHALFDRLELGLPNGFNEEIRTKIAIMRRRRALSEWLQSAVASSVETDTRESGSDSWAATVFTLLTGNQLEKACNEAINAGNVKLATLLSQIPGDEDFRQDLRAQLTLWREQQVDAHIDENVRKIYALLAGVVDVVEGSKGSDPERASDLALAAGLDWKRAFGLHLWFSERMDTPIADAFQSYCNASEDPITKTSKPIPWYREETATDDSHFLWKLPVEPTPPDALFSLIQLFSQPQCTLSDILAPLSFSGSPVDYRLSWHLYIILSRSLRIRDFADRGEPELDTSDNRDDDIKVEGHSPTADLLANSYANQLEKLGLIQEAVFVLLHIEGSAGRKRAIKDLLSRSASKLDDWMTRGLVGSLKIPLTWVNEAKATFALSEGDVFSAYELYLSADMYNAAHNLAVLELAPDAVIRQDLGLLSDLFQRFEGQPVDGWSIRGKLFLDYANAMTRIPKLREQVLDSGAVPDTTQANELEELTRGVPKLISLLPDVLPDHHNLRYKAALSEMITGLTLLIDRVRPLAIQSQLRTPLATEATRLRHIHAIAIERFTRTIEVS
ncbi:hypothetical protein QCA50_015457 [Cerrena zonata]|uniref:Nuclear pore complex protein NUP96 C-terminal domain-containing protein n=1 Tax=Cerrena zonata TaxID=2478898 RepID=A0AAW0FL67_9APHY